MCCIFRDILALIDRLPVQITYDFLLMFCENYGHILDLFEGIANLVESYVGRKSQTFCTAPINLSARMTNEISCHCVWVRKLRVTGVVGE